MTNYKQFCETQRYLRTHRWQLIRAADNANVCRYENRRQAEAAAKRRGVIVSVDRGKRTVTFDEGKE